MKDRGEMTSVNDRTPLLPSFRQSDPHHPHHDHRLNRKPAGGGEEAWGTLPTKGADINLLANSLSSRLRRAARHRAATSSTGTTPTTTSSGSRSAPPEESTRKSSKVRSKQDSQPHVPASILKRTLSKDAAEQHYRQLLEQSSRNGGPQDIFHLPDVFMTRRLSSSAGHIDRIAMEMEGFNNQYLDRPSPTLALFGGGAGGGSTRTHTGNGHLAWVKRAGIFQPADKYAPGRQNLHGEDQPFALSQPVDYETVTLSSRPNSPDSDATSGWSSGKGSRRKGLKVSWKHPSVSDGQEPEEDPCHPTDTASSGRQKSAGTVQSEPAAYSFVKPKFNPGKSCVPVVGVKWKVPTPLVGRPLSSSGLEEVGRRPSSGDSSGPSSPASIHSMLSTLPAKTPSKPTSHTRDSRHPWRALYPRDMHPVTTAMEREGTSVSKTKWQVPSVRPVPAYTFIEDLMESRLRQWHPSMQSARLATQATVDSQSIQNRLKEGMSTSSKDTAGSATVSDATDQNLQANNHL